MPLFGKRSSSGTSATSPTGAHRGFFKVLYLGSTRTGLSRNAADLAHSELRAMHTGPSTMTKIVIRVSIYGFQAKLWPHGDYLLDLNLANLREISATARTVVLIFKDATDSDVAQPMHTMHVMFCESPMVAREIATNLNRLCAAVAAAMKEIRLAGGIDRVELKRTDSEKVLVDYLPADANEVAYSSNGVVEYSFGNMPIAEYEQARRTSSFSVSVENLTSDTMDARLAELELAMVAFYDAQDTSIEARRLMTEFERAAARLLPNSIMLGKVDIKTETEIANKYRIESTPKLKVFQFGVMRSELDYDGEPSQDAIVAYMAGIAGVDSKEDVDTRDGQPTNVTPEDSIGYIGIVDPASITSPVDGMANLVESSEVLSMVPGISVNDAELVAKGKSNAPKSVIAADELYAIEAGEQPPSRAFVTSLSKSMRMSENSQMVVLPQALNENYWAQLL